MACIAVLPQLNNKFYLDDNVNHTFEISYEYDAHDETYSDDQYINQPFQAINSACDFNRNLFETKLSGTRKKSWTNIPELVNQSETKLSGTGKKSWTNIPELVNQSETKLSETKQKSWTNIPELVNQS